MTSALRIVHCFRSPVGGIFRHVRDLTEAQVAAGHQVGIVCDSTTGGAFEEKLFEEMRPLLALGIRRTAMQRHIGPGDLASGWRTYRLIKELQPDVLHGHGAKGGAYSRLFGSLMRVSGSRVARLYTAHGGSLHYDENTLTGKVFFLLERIMERFCDRLLFVSEYERGTFIRKVGLPRIPSALVYNGLRDAEFEPVATAPGAADFVYIGMMRDLKGPDLFIDALARTEMRLGRAVSAVMVGDGEDRPRYIAQVERLGLSDRVKFLMPMPAREAFGLGRVSVVPSRAEAMPYIVLETLGAGRPMIATAVGGIPEVFGEGSAALAQPDVEEISERMVLALSDPETFAMAMPSTEELRTRFSARTMAAEIENAYWAALGREPTAGEMVS
ncbi:MAG: glycosyltransferase family 4 protein [Rhizobiaceae bacterium]